MATLFSYQIATNYGCSIDWIGTSMGGIIGMMLASVPNSPIRKLVLNDIGAFLPYEGLLRIATYVSNPPQFENIEKAINYFKDVHKPFGLQDDQWPLFAEHSVRKVVIDGKTIYELHYDPAISNNFKDISKVQEVSLWTFWDKIKCPVMLIRGKDSDILPSEIVNQMRNRGPGLAEFIEFNNVGHAPGLMIEQQVEPIRQFLNR